MNIVKKILWWCGTVYSGFAALWALVIFAYVCDAQCKFSVAMKYMLFFAMPAMVVVFVVLAVECFRKAIVK